MEHLFPGLEPPKRSTDEKETSLQIIKQRTLKQKKLNWQYYTTVCAAIAVFFVLLASLTSVPLNENHTNTASGEIKEIYVFKQTTLHSEYRTQMSKWYNLDKNKLSKTEIETFQTIIARSEKIQQPINMKTNLNYAGFITKYSDGTEHFYLLNYEQNELLNLTAKEKVVLERDEARFLMNMEIKTDEKRMPFIIKIVIIFGLVAGYFTLLQKVSPIRKIIEAENDISKWKIFRKGFGSLLAIIIILSISSIYYEAYNLLFIATFFTLYFLLKKCWQWYRGNTSYSYLEIPISAIFFTILSIIYIL